MHASATAIKPEDIRALMTTAFINLSQRGATVLPKIAIDFDQPATLPLRYAQGPLHRADLRIPCVAAPLP